MTRLVAATYVILTAHLLCACATDRDALRPSSVAVLPPVAVGLPEEAVERTRTAISEAVGQVCGAPVVDSGRIDRAMHATKLCRERGPARQNGCAVAAGREVGASHVVSGAIGGLGNTRVVQLRLLQVASGTVIRSLEETLFGKSTTVAMQTGVIAGRLFGSRRTPWYGHWWVWTAAVVVVATAVVVPAVLLSNSDPNETVSLP